MQCEIYKGSRKEHTYLYVEKPIDEDELPETLLALLGKLTFVMDLDITAETKLVTEDAVEVVSEVTAKGFYLQLPPKI